MRNHIKIVSVLLALMMLLSVLPVSVSVSVTAQTHQHSFSDVASINFYPVRDIIAGYDDVSSAFAADITFKDGETFLFDFAYAYLYDYDTGDMNYYTYEDFEEAFFNGFVQFTPERDLDTPGKVNVKISNEGVTPSFDINKSAVVNVVEDPIDRIEAVDNVILNSNNGHEREDWIGWDETTGNSIYKTYFGYESYAPTDVLIYYKDGTTASLSEKFDEYGSSYSHSFNGISYKEFVNTGSPYNGAPAYSKREAVEYISHQEDEPWEIGNTYQASVRYMGHEATYDVEIIEGLPYYPASPDEVLRNEDNPDFEYAVYNDKAVIVKYDGVERNVVIPATIGGFPVDAIGREAFKDNDWVRRIDISNGIRIIEDSAFYHCYQLKSVNIPETMRRIGFGAFAYCYDLDSVVIPDSVTDLYDRAFDGCSSLKSVSISNTVREIGYMTFARCERLTSVTIPSSVLEIGQWAFEGCTRLTKVTIPNSVRKIDEQAFIDCNRLKGIDIPASVIKINKQAFGYQHNEDWDPVLVDHFYIRGSEGSEAQRYAEENGILFLLPGEEPPAIEDTYPEIKVGDTVSVTIDNPDETTYLKFVPEKDMMIVFSADIDDNRYSHWSQVCDDIFDPVAYNDGNHIACLVEAGNTYYLGTGIRYDTGTYDVTLNEIEVADINLGDRVKLNVEGEAFLRFIPDKDMLISYRSDSTRDTFGTIYDENFEYITSDDDAGTDNNFKIIYPVEKGEVYYLGARFFGDNNKDTINVILEENTDIWLYENNGSDNGITITGYYGNDLDVEIPSEFDGNPVTKIGAGVFSNSALTRVVIPDTVTAIDNNAFNNSKKLKEIVIPDSVIEVGESAFSSTAWYDDQPEGVVYTGRVAYGVKGNVSKIAFKEGTVSIASQAFSYNHYITEVTIPDSLTTIGYQEFYHCPSLKQITIPPTVTEIGYNAFGYYDDIELGTTKVDGFTIYGYENSAAEQYADENDFDFVAIGTIELPEYEYTIRNGKVTIQKYNGRAADVVIPSEIEGYPVTDIGFRAFCKKFKMTSLTIPDTIRNIEDDAFCDCKNLRTITMYCRDFSYYYSAFDGCTDCTLYGYENTLAEDIANHQEYTFVALDPSALPEYDTIIDDDGLFTLVRYNGNKEEITTPAVIDGHKVEKIDLNRNKYLKKVTISDGATELAPGAFSSTPNLESITIPDSVTKVGMYALVGTKWLEEQYNSNPEEPIIYAGKVALYVKDQINTPEHITLRNDTVGISDNTFHHTAIKSITIPDSLKTIGSGAFVGCNKLQSISIPDGVTELPSQIFINCTALESVSLPKGIKSIGFVCFGNCSALKNIELPEGLNTIGRSAFSGCSSLTEISIPASVKSIANNAFFDCASLNKVTVLNPRAEIMSRSLGYRYDEEREKQKKIEGFTIYGYSGSTAEAYANRNGFDFVSIGQADIADNYGYEPGAYYLTGRINGAYYSYDDVSPALNLQSKDGGFHVETPLRAGDRISVVRYLGNGLFASVTEEREVEQTGFADVALQTIAPFSKNLMIAVTDKNGAVTLQTESFIRTGNAPIRGDIDDNGKISAVDVTNLQRFIVRIDPTIGEYAAVGADIDHDGIISVVDNTFIQRYLAGMDIPYSIGDTVG